MQSLLLTSCKLTDVFALADSIESIARERKNVLNRLETLKRIGSDSSTQLLAVILSNLYADIHGEMGTRGLQVDRVSKLIESKLEQNDSTIKKVKMEMETQGKVIEDLSVHTTMLEGVALGVSLFSSLAV